jgi:hypothetical protein
MSISVEAFKNRLIGGGARSNLFKVQLTVPSFLIAAAGGNDFEYFCRAASMPGVTVETVNVSHQGRVVKVYGNRTFEDYTMTVYNDEDHKYRDLFFQWSNRINGLESNLSQVQDAGVLNNYKASAIITQLGKDGSALRAYRLVGCFPTVVAPIDVNWDSTTAIQEFTVTLAYDYWVPTQSSSPGLGVNIPDGAFSLPIIR